MTQFITLLAQGRPQTQAQQRQPPGTPAGPRQQSHAPWAPGTPPAGCGAPPLLRQQILTARQTHRSGVPSSPLHLSNRPASLHGPPRASLTSAAIAGTGRRLGTWFRRDQMPQTRRPPSCSLDRQPRPTTAALQLRAVALVPTHSQRITTSETLWLRRDSTPPGLLAPRAAAVGVREEIN